MAITPAQATKFRFSGAGELVSLDPHTVTDTVAVVYLSHLYESLVMSEPRSRLFRSPEPANIRVYSYLCPPAWRCIVC